MADSEIHWLDDIEEHNYPAALSYLSLIYADDVTKSLVKKLKAAEVRSFKAKDIFRASGLSLLGVSNAHIEKDRRKISNGKALSPLLLVRDTPNGRVVVADGYHRLCAIYEINEDAWIKCKIV